MKVLVGTTNLNKYKNYKDAFNLYAPDVELLNVADLKITDEAEENSSSLLGNAMKKAKFFGDKSGILTIADDAGLFVDALGGEPGINAKRWHNGTDHDRCVKLLERLKGKNRTARYKWGFAAYNPLNNKTWEFECTVEGSIADDFRDNGGFGYDKMFKLLGTEKYYSELSAKELIKAGGRGVAMKELIFNTNFLK